jgi:hypothetical protein
LSEVVSCPQLLYSGSHGCHGSSFLPKYHLNTTKDNADTRRAAIMGWPASISGMPKNTLPANVTHEPVLVLRKSYDLRKKGSGDSSLSLYTRISFFMQESVNNVRECNDNSNSGSC